MKPKRGRAQASLELLIVFAALLAFLSAWIPIAESIRERALEEARLTEARVELSQISSAAEEAYILGDGNSRTVYAGALKGASLAISDNMIAAKIGGNQLQAKGRFRAHEKTVMLGESSPYAGVRCCSEEGIELTSSTGSP